MEWTVPGIITHVTDGDTLRITLDLGWGLYKKDHVRILGINAPEVSTTEGIFARDALAIQLSAVQGIDYRGLDIACPCTVVSKKLDKYGRALADVIVGSPSWSIADWMVNEGLALTWDGVGPKPTLPYHGSTPEQPGS